MNCRKCACLIADTDDRCPMCDAKQWRSAGTSKGFDVRVVAIVAVILVMVIVGVLITNVDFGNTFGGSSARTEFERNHHELVGEWAWITTNTTWFRFYEDGGAVNLYDGEHFTWNEDGSLNAIIYESWSISNGVLTVTWSDGTTFDYLRAD